MSADRIYGIGDILLNYRYQALEEGEVKPAFAPRFSLILPTGNRDAARAMAWSAINGRLPFSKKLGPRFAPNANFGVNLSCPRVRSAWAAARGTLSPRHSLVTYNVGAQRDIRAIAAVSPDARVDWRAPRKASMMRARPGGHSCRHCLPGFRDGGGERGEIAGRRRRWRCPIGLNHKADNHGAFLYFSIEHNLF